MQERRGTHGGRFGWRCLQAGALRVDCVISLRRVEMVARYGKELSDGEPLGIREERTTKQSAGGCADAPHTTNSRD